MNAIPLINNAPRPNINVGSVGSPAFNPVAAGAKLGGSIGGNVMRQNPASMPVNNETQLRQEVNTSIVALKREAFSLENLIAQAAQTLQDINKRLSELEGKQGDYVKKADATVESVGGNGKYISAISETDGKINATATDLGNMVPVNSVTSGNMHSVTSNAVARAINPQEKNLNIDTLYPSENGKIENYFGNFSGNVPETKANAILKVSRIKRESSNEIQLYQQWIGYSSDTDYSPNEYIRFGYFTGSASPTWSSWQRLVRDTDVGNLKFFYKNYGQVSISAGVTLYDLPTELSGKNIIMAFGAIGSYLMPRPHLNNAGQYAQSWGLGVSLTGRKLNILTPDTWSGILQIVFIYI